jgi:cytochrome c
MPAKYSLFTLTRSNLLIAGALFSTLLVCIRPACASERQYGFGQAPTAAEITAWDIDVRADGKGLPPGHGSAAEGAKLFADRCAACHGITADRAAAPIEPLTGGIGTLATAKPTKTVGSYWPYATTLFDFIHRAMPFDAPQSLSADEVYALTAYLLSLNGIIGPDAVLDAKTLPKVQMPNRDGFVVHDWRGTHAVE